MRVVYFPFSLAFTLTLEVKRVSKLVNFLPRCLVHRGKCHVGLSAGITNEAANLLLQCYHIWYPRWHAGFQRAPLDPAVQLPASPCALSYRLSLVTWHQGHREGGPPCELVCVQLFLRDLSSTSLEARQAIHVSCLSCPLKINYITYQHDMARAPTHWLIAEGSIQFFVVVEVVKLTVLYCTEYFIAYFAVFTSCTAMHFKHVL